MTLSNEFKKTALKFPNKIAIEFGEQKVTFMGIQSNADRFANALEKLGVKKGDRVAHYLGNSLELVYSLVGNFNYGTPVVPINVNFKEQEILHILSDSEACAIVTDSERYEVLKNVTAQLPNLKHIIISDRKIKNCHYFDELIKNAEDSCNSAVKDDDNAIFFYTSGTTGKPKGAPLTNANVVAGVKSLVFAWKLTSEDIFILSLPLYHIHGIGVALCTLLYTANTTILSKKFSAEETLELIERKKATLFMGVPTMYFKILEVPNAKKYDISSMRLFVSGSAPMSKELFEDFRKKFGYEVLERAGMSESMMNFSNPLRGKKIPGSVGPCLPGVSVKITDKNFKEVPVGTEGEILIKGPNVFHGYWKKDNSEVFKDGWFVTGDLGKIDSNGYVYIIGRSKDLIISGGINIYPREIEELIESMPEVLECAVVGVPDKEFGESVKAFVVLQSKKKISEEEVISFCKSKLASFKKPKYVEFLDSLPKNTMGKIQKSVLRGR